MDTKARGFEAVMNVRLTDSHMLLQEHKRILIEDTTALQFPLRSLGRAAGLNVGPKTVVLRANGGRKGRFL